MLAVGEDHPVRPVVVLHHPRAALGGRGVVGGASFGGAAALGRVVVVAVGVLSFSGRAGGVAVGGGAGGSVLPAACCEGVRVFGVAVAFVLVFAGLRAAVALRRDFDAHLQLLAGGGAAVGVGGGGGRTRLLRAGLFPPAVVLLVVVVVGGGGNVHVRAGLLLHAVLQLRRLFFPVLFQSQHFLRAGKGGGPQLLVVAAPARSFMFVLDQREVRVGGLGKLVAEVLVQAVGSRDAVQARHGAGVRAGEEGVGDGGEAV